MSIASEITRLQNAKTALATSIANKGVTVPAATTLDGYPALVDAIQTGGGSEGWQRPSGWPDYSKIPLANVGANEVYITYDCRYAIAGDEPKGVSFRAAAIGGYTVERGSIGSSGFVAAATSSMAHNATFQELLPTNEGNYVVYRVTSSGNITYFGFDNWNNYIGDKPLERASQPILEMYGKLENVGSFIFRTTNIVSFSVVLKSMADMSNLFSPCASLKNVDTTGWDTSSVTTMANMFKGCNTLEYIDVSNFDTSNVTNMQSVFQECTLLKNIDVNNWDMSKVTTMVNMFNGCTNLASLDVSRWTTTALTNLQGTFASCQSLSTLDVSGWDTSHVTTMQTMLSNTHMLAELDLSRWNLSALTNTTQMLNTSRLISTIHFGDTLTTVSAQSFQNTYFCLAYIFESTTPPTLANANAFQGINSAAKIYVPDASVDAYKTATNWSTYASYIYPISDYTE